MARGGIQGDESYIAPAAPRWPGAGVSALLSAAATIHSAAIENVQLSAEITALGNDVADVAHFELSVDEVQLTPDGERVVYLADDDYDNVRELYSAPTAGDAPPVKLHADLAPPAGSVADVVSFAITPDSSQVVFCLGQLNSRRAELWVAPVDGATPPYRLRSEAAHPDPEVGQFLITPDGETVVFNAFSEADKVWELYSVPTDAGSPPVELSLGAVESGSTANNRPVDQWEISADNRWVVYSAVRDVETFSRLYSAEVGVAGSEVLLDGAAPIKTGPEDLAITPDSQYVVYRAAQFTARTDLISVQIDGSSQVRRISDAGGNTVQGFGLGGVGATVAYKTGQGGVFRLFTVNAGGGPPLQRATGNVPLDFALSHDATQLVYRFAAPFSDDILYSIGSGGGDRVELGSAQAITSFNIHPDGSHVTFLGDPDTDNVDELFTVPIGGGDPVRIHGPRGSPERDFDADIYHISPDTPPGSSLAVFVGEAEAGDGLRLFSAPARPTAPGGTATEISGNLAEGGGVIPEAGHIEISSDNSRIVFPSDRIRDGVIELFSATPSGGEPALLNAGYAPAGDVTAAWASPDSEWLVYRADQDWDGRFDLYLVPTKRGSEPVRINAIERRTSFADAGEKVAFSPDSEKVFFLGPSAGSPFLKLFVYEIATGTRTQLSPDQTEVANNSFVRTFRLHPDGSSVIYLADHRDFANPELYRVPIAQPGQATKLHADIPGTAEIREDFAIRPDGDAVVFSGDIEINEQFELFSLDLGTPEISDLSDMPDGANDVTEGGFRFADGGDKVVFLAPRGGGTVFELFVVPSDGAATPTKLSGDLVFGGDVDSDFEITPDGGLVVFRADAARDGLHELFSADLTAPIPGRIKLHADLPAGTGGVQDFVIKPKRDGLPYVPHVAYRSGATPSDKVQLFLATAGVAGSGAQISPASTHGSAEVRDDFAFSPDGGRLLFRGDLRLEDRPDLYRLPVPSGAADLVNPASTGDGSVLAFTVSSDSYRVAYLQQAGGEERADAYSLRLEDGGELRKMNLPVAAPKAVHDYTAAMAPWGYLPDGSQLQFVDDRCKDETFELHTAFELPTISAIGDHSIFVNGILGPLPFTVGDLETRPEEIIVAATSSDQGLIPDGNLVISGTGADRTITVTPAMDIAGGPVTITIAATAKREVATETFTVTIGDEYRIWLEGFFDPADLDDPSKEASHWGLRADFDKDGIHNIAEWGKGLDPTLNDVGQDVFEASADQTAVTLTFRRPKPAPATLATSFRHSESLLGGSWTAIEPVANPAPVRDLGDAELVEARFPRAALGQDAFLRITYTRR